MPAAVCPAHSRTPPHGRVEGRVLKTLGRMGHDNNTYSASPGDSTQQEGVLVRIAIGFTAWAERWFPDAFIFVAIAVVVVALAALVNGASPLAVSKAFGDGFWSLITFTMQMAFVAIGGYVVATSAPAGALIRRLANSDNRPWRHRPRGGGQHVGLAAQLGTEPDLRRPSGARTRRTA